MLFTLGLSTMPFPTPHPSYCSSHIDDLPYTRFNPCLLLCSYAPNIPVVGVAMIEFCSAPSLPLATITPCRYPFQGDHSGSPSGQAKAETSALVVYLQLRSAFQPLPLPIPHSLSIPLFLVLRSGRLSRLPSPPFSRNSHTSPSPFGTGLTYQPNHHLGRRYLRTSRNRLVRPPSTYSNSIEMACCVGKNWFGSICFCSYCY